MKKSDSSTAPSEHDFLQSRWGHSISTISDDGLALGHGNGVKAGDTMLLEMTSGKIGRWRVLEVEYWRDPPDMFKAKIEFENYKEPGATSE